MAPDLCRSGDRGDSANPWNGEANILKYRAKRPDLIFPIQTERFRSESIREHFLLGTGDSFSLCSKHDHEFHPRAKRSPRIPESFSPGGCKRALPKSRRRSAKSKDHA